MQISELYELNFPMKPVEFWDKTELMINVQKEQLAQMAFNIYDLGQDKFIDQVDLYALLKLYDTSQDDLFIKAYA